MDKEETKLKQLVIKTYSSIASQGSCCAMPATCCSSESNPMNLLETGRLIGYSDEELKIGLGEANLGLGCGNPIAIAGLKEGETVLDLGSGAGFDAFLSAMKVGSEGRVIGVDMTPEMIIKAKDNAQKLGVNNVEFRHGDIEHLPADDNSVCIGGRAHLVRGQPVEELEAAPEDPDVRAEELVGRAGKEVAAEGSDIDGAVRGVVH